MGFRRFHSYRTKHGQLSLKSASVVSVQSPGSICNTCNEPVIFAAPAKSFTLVTTVCRIASEGDCGALTPKSHALNLSPTASVTDQLSSWLTVDCRRRTIVQDTFRFLFGSTLFERARCFCVSPQTSKHFMFGGPFGGSISRVQKKQDEFSCPNQRFVLLYTPYTCDYHVFWI